MISEQFILHEFEVYDDKASAIREGHFHNVVVGLRCPRCERLQPVPAHGGAPVPCAGECGVSMRVLGNTLYATLVGVTQP